MCETKFWGFLFKNKSKFEKTEVHNLISNITDLKFFAAELS